MEAVLPCKDSSLLKGWLHRHTHTRAHTHTHKRYSFWWHMRLPRTSKTNGLWQQQLISSLTLDHNRPRCFARGPPASAWAARARCTFEPLCGPAQACTMWGRRCGVSAGYKALPTAAQGCLSIHMKRLHPQPMLATGGNSHPQKQPAMCPRHCLPLSQNLPTPQRRQPADSFLCPSANATMCTSRLGPGTRMRRCPVRLRRGPHRTWQPGGSGIIVHVQGSQCCIPCLVAAQSSVLLDPLAMSA